MLEDHDMGRAVLKAIENFQRINRADRLSAEDKRRLKEAYVRNYMEPEARRLLQQKLDARKRRDPRPHGPRS